MKLKVVQISLLAAGLATMLLSYLSGVPENAGITHPKVCIPLVIFAGIPVTWAINWARRKKKFF